MKIYNILINSKDIFINKLLNELSKNNIKYLFIKEDENNLFDELHYNNKIYRFFSKKNVIKYITLNNDNKPTNNFININDKALNIEINQDTTFKNNEKTYIPKLKTKKNSIYKQKVKILNKNRKNR